MWTVFLFLNEAALALFCHLCVAQIARIDLKHAFPRDSLTFSILAALNSTDASVLPGCVSCERVHIKRNTYISKCCYQNVNILEFVSRNEIYIALVFFFLYIPKSGSRRHTVS